MREFSASQIKRHCKGKDYATLQIQPAEGTTTRKLYDLLMASLGKPVNLVPIEKRAPNLYSMLSNLRVFYGLDIRCIQRKDQYKKSMRKTAETLHACVGEWFGQIYVDYTCDTEEQMDLLVKAREALVSSENAKKLLPEGMRRLSKKDEDILRRIAEKGDAAMEKHSKHVS